MNILFLSCIAGVLGTGIGGVLGIVFSKINAKTTNNVLSFAGGCMLSMVFFSIFPESMELTSPINILLSATFGILTLSLINYILNISTKNKQTKIQAFICNYQNKNNSKRLLKAGLIMFFAIALHNIPEGLAIGTTGVVNFKTAITLSILLMIHNIPEGMAISAPLIAGGVSKIKSLIFATLAGALTIVGGLIGLIISNINSSISALALAFSGGAMLNVTFCDIYPEVFENQTSSTHIANFLGMGLIFLIVMFVWKIKIVNSDKVQNCLII